jgi:predicted anti-sigma-YlaC factor YlaD
VICEDVRAEAAVALLTGDPVSDEVSEHLDSCPECREELHGLGPLPGLLAMLDEQDVAASEPDPVLLDRLLSAASAERRRRRARLLSAAAAAVLVLVVPLGVWGVVQFKNRPPAVTSATPTAPAAIDRTASDASTGIKGEVKVWKSAWGSDLTVSISGVRAGTRCTVVVITADGQSETAATWEASYSGTAQVRGNVAASVSAISRIDIVDDTGKVLLRM